MTKKLQFNRNAGELALVAAIVEQAIADVRRLKRRGLIVDGECATQCTLANRSNGSGDMCSCTSEVEMLIELFRDGASGHIETLLGIVGCDITAREIRAELGLLDDVQSIQYN